MRQNDIRKWFDENQELVKRSFENFINEHRNEIDPDPTPQVNIINKIKYGMGTMCIFFATEQCIADCDKCGHYNTSELKKIGLVDCINIYFAGLALDNNKHFSSKDLADEIKLWIKAQNVDEK